ncbi:zinc ribbon domain-containing protein [Streptomyces scabichelini]|uniref:Zn-ribbon domain-containing OB-fold protein n=1 Tax=Streptomyces scabichelini TaxID=2711217 RepID=UPI0019D2E294
MFHPGSRTAAGVLDAETPTTTSQSEEGLFYQRCRWCGTAMFHRLLCPVCAGSDLRTERSAGLGVVRHAAIVQRNTPAARNVSLVELAEGFTVRGRVLGPLIAIRVGDRVQLATAADPVRREPVFKLREEPYSGWL